MMTLEKQDTMRMEVLKRSVNRSIGGGGGGKSSPPIARDGSGNMGRVWTATGMLNHNPNLRGHHINSRNYYGNSNDSTNSMKKEETEGQGKQLGVIDLSGMCLDRIPNPNTINPASIFKLDLSGNNLQSIPESLTARLLNVVVLDVHSNQLSSLPNSIGCLSKLKTLNVSGNFLTSLPVTIENCKSLEELDVNFNKLKNLPDTIGFELPNLKKLSVNSNKLVRLPYSLCHLTTLRVLDVRLNCLCSLPEDLENLINLQTLNVSQNFQYLRELPYSIGLLLSLVELDVSYNSISTLPSSIGCLRKLQKLSVEGNPLISPPKSVIKQGLQAIKVYMGDKINNGDKSPKKKSKWFSRLLKKHGTIHSSAPHEQDNHDSKIKGFATPEYRLIDALASPRYLSLGRFSPRRLFSSPRHDLCSR